jgi:hypothetical protein
MEALFAKPQASNLSLRESEKAPNPTLQAPENLQKPTIN